LNITTGQNGGNLLMLHTQWNICLLLEEDLEQDHPMSAEVVVALEAQLIQA
jgi:hypothetical protein